MRATRNIFASLCLIASAAWGQTTAGDDIKDAGKSAGHAAKRTTTATGKITWKGVKKTGHYAKKGSKKVVHVTGSGLEKGGEKMKNAAR
jgi:hypothetical protein